MGLSALHLAFLYDFPKAVAEILRHDWGRVLIGEKVGATGGTALHYASIWGKSSAVAQLLGTYVGRNSAFERDKGWNTPLHLVAFQLGYRAKITRLLLDTSEGRMALNMANKDSKTPRDLAAENGFSEVLDMILEELRAGPGNEAYEEW